MKDLHTLPYSSYSLSLLFGRYVKKLLGPYLVFLSSTVNGYEGTGRSLSLKLIKKLREQSAAGTAGGVFGCCELRGVSCVRRVLCESACSLRTLSSTLCVIV